MSDLVLQSEHITKSFASPGGDISVLKGVNIAVNSGESVSITGESGSGKTTLLNILAGLEAPDNGSIYWENSDITKLSQRELYAKRAACVGFVFQSYYLIPELNALENVIISSKIAGIYNKESRKRAEHLLDVVGLAGRMSHLTTKLSGGEKQRVALARALMNKPKLILGDEPTGNLDEETGENVINTLMELCCREYTALLLVTHNRSHAQRTDRQLVLKDGVLNEA